MPGRKARLRDPIRLVQSMASTLSRGRTSRRFRRSEIDDNAAAGRSRFRLIGGCRRLLWAGLLAAALPLGLLSLPGGSSDATLSDVFFTAAEDASVISRDPGSNFGTASSLRVENNPAAEWALLKFPLAEIPRDARITSATLRLYALSDAADAGSVYAIEEDWSETRVTWANAPAVGRKLADLPGPVQAGSWVEVDVTPDVAGGADLDLYLMSWGSDPVTYASREAANTAPTLRVRWSRGGRSTPTLRSTPTSAPTAVPTVRPSLTPIPAPSLTPTPAPGLTATPVPGFTQTPVPGLTPTPAPGPTSIAVPGGSFQPEPPIQAAFFYSWFSEAWEQQGLYPYTNYTPSLGLYDSSDGALIDQQIQMASRAHIEAFIASWWGQGHHTDAAFQYILDRSERSDSPYQDLRWAVYYEAEGYGNPGVSEIVSDLEYLDRVFSRPGYLKINGRPVVFVYADGADGCDMVDRWAKAKSQVGSNPFVVLKVFSGYRTCDSQPDSWHQYGPASPYDSQLPYSVSVSPGFWKAGEAPRLARDAGRFESDVKRMVDSGAFWQLITTWNEWGEGSIVEAAAEFGNTYVDILCRNMSGAARCSTSGATPGLTPSPTPEPEPTPEPTPAPSPAPSASSNHSLTFTVSEDTFVKDSSPGSNYGGRTKLEADSAPSLKRTLVRFQVSGLPDDASVSSAVLRLFVVDPSSEAGSVHAVAGSWSEYAATWNIAPAVGRKIAELSSPARAGSWVQADVTSAISGDGVIDFFIVTSSENGVDYSSSERGDANPPTLIIRWTGSPTPYSPTPTPVPPLASGAAPVLVGAGDIADCKSSWDEATARLLDKALAGGNGLVYTLGDNVYNAGTPGEFAECYEPTWGQYRELTRPSVGNHEYGTPDARGYFDYFGAAAGDPDKGYYSYDLGDWHIVVLNSNCDKVGGCEAGSPQERWLRADLAANSSACTLAYWHQPLFSSGSHGNSDVMRDIYRALYERGADVVLGAHDHDYERFAPQDPDGVADPERGIRQFVVGTGGKSLYKFKEIRANSEVRNSDTFGVLRLTLNATSYDWEFLPVAGSSFTDSGSQACH